MEFKITTARHPRYSFWEPKWTFFLGSYLGGEEFVSANLFKYFKEGDEEYAARQKRAYRENHSKRVVDLINSYLFKEPPTRKTENAKIQEFIDNFDGKGRSATRCMKIASQWASAAGRIYLVVDKKPIPDDQKTDTQADNLKGTPYVYPVFPQDVLDIAFTEEGNVKWAIIREKYRDDDDPRTADSIIRERYRLWEVGKWTLYSDEGVETQTGETGLDCVPIVIVDNEEHDVYGGQSLISDIAYLDRAIFNNWSRLDTIVNDQTFSQLIFPVEGLNADVLSDPDLREQFLTLATNRVILYSAAAQATPQFISPDASQAQFILSMIAKQTEQLYASLGLQAETATIVKAAESGVSKAYDFDKLNKLLASKASNLDQAEEQIFDIARQWFGGGGGDVEIEYPTEFDVKGLVDEIDIAERMALLDISRTLMAEINKNIAAKALPKADQETIDAVNEEIEQKAKDDAERSQFANDNLFDPNNTGLTQTIQRARMDPMNQANANNPMNRANSFVGNTSPVSRKSKKKGKPS